MDIDSVTLALHDGICKRKSKCKDRATHAERISNYINTEPLATLLMNASK